MVGVRVVEFDGYKSVPMMIPQTIEDWHNPVLVNGAIFSNFRYPTKEEVRARGNNKYLVFSKIGTYLLEDK